MRASLSIRQGRTAVDFCAFPVAGGRHHADRQGRPDAIRTHPHGYRRHRNAGHRCDVQPGRGGGGIYRGKQNTCSPPTTKIHVLREENERLRRWRAAAQSLESENARLRGLLNFHPEAEATFITGRVIGDSGGAFLRSVLVDIGGRDGVRKGAAAIDGNGLVGRVAEVGQRSARILLITDLNSRIPVLVGDKRERAILAGDNSDLARLVYLPPERSIGPGRSGRDIGPWRRFPGGAAGRHRRIHRRGRQRRIARATLPGAGPAGVRAADGFRPDGRSAGPGPRPGQPVGSDVSGSSWNSFDTIARNSTPSLLLLFLVVLGQLPFSLPGDSAVTPYFVLMAVFYWGLHRPDSAACDRSYSWSGCCRMRWRANRSA